MAELFIELFSEEIPAKLQIDARQKIKQIIDEKLQKKEINFKSSKSFSTPKRLVFFVDGIPEKIEQKKKVIKGPRTQAPQAALDGFIKSNNLSKTDIYKKKIEIPLNEVAKHQSKEKTKNNFTKVKTCKFHPNSLLIFPRTNDSFHGVDEINIEAKERDLLSLNYFIYGLK